MAIQICKWCGKEYHESSVEDFCNSICEEAYDSDMTECKNEWEEEREKERNQESEDWEDPMSHYLDSPDDIRYLED